MRHKTHQYQAHGPDETTLVPRMKNGTQNSLATLTEPMQLKKYLWRKMGHKTHQHQAHGTHGNIKKKLWWEMGHKTHQHQAHGADVTTLVPLMRNGTQNSLASRTEPTKEMPPLKNEIFSLWEATGVPFSSLWFFDENVIHYFVF